DDRLQELEVDVTVAVVAQPLSAEEEFGTERGGMAYGIDIAQVVLIRNVSGAERHPVDVIAILDRYGEGGGIVRRTAGRGVRGERINDERARDSGEVRGADRSKRWGAGRSPSAGARRTAVEESTASGHIDRARRAGRNRCTGTRVGTLERDVACRR